MEFYRSQAFSRGMQTRLSQRKQRVQNLKHASGASMVEFIIVTPLLLFIAFGILQIGLVYHAKSILEYATFEAARAGAVNNGQINSMRKELGYRMAPVFGGDGSLEKGAAAMARASVFAQDLTLSKIEILNPTTDTFAVHGEYKTVTDSNNTVREVLAIPNSHLRLRDHEDIKNGLNVQDANLLKIRATYGFQMRLPFLDMEIPGVKFAMRSVLLRTDPDNWMYYIRGLLPINATAMVRMQSEAWDTQSEPLVVSVFNDMFEWTSQQIDRNKNTNDNPDTDSPITDNPDIIIPDTYTTDEEYIECVVDNSRDNIEPYGNSDVATARTSAFSAIQKQDASVCAALNFDASLAVVLQDNQAGRLLGNSACRG